ncbi:MAG: rhomboid family intramembrane serine protease [Bacteroidota bacterium]
MNSQDKIAFRRSLFTITFFLAAFWLIKVVEISLEFSLVQYGNYPRTLKGVTGIITSPFIHADFQHLFSNSFPFLFLGVGLFYFHRKIAWHVLIIIYLLSGFWVWLTARDAYHIGASGIIYGLMAFLLVIGFLRKDRASMATSFIVLVLYGGSVFIDVLPTDSGVSWESHLLGAVAGLFCAVFFRKPSPDNITNSEAQTQVTAQNDFHYTFTPRETNSNKGKPYTYRIDLDHLNKKDSNSE